jgi:hypothetical protein
MRIWLMLWRKDRTRAVLLCSLAFTICALVVVSAQAQEYIQPVGGDWTQRWLTFPNILAALTLVFHFGLTFQTLRDHGRRLVDLEEWRREIEAEHRRRLSLQPGGGL